MELRYKQERQYSIVSPSTKDDLAFFQGIFFFPLVVGPRIMGEALEFSIEIIFNTGDAENLTEIRCETKTFPPSSVSWLLINEEYPCEEEEEEGEGEGERRRCGIKVQDLDFDNLMLLDYGTMENLTLSTNAIIEMLNLQYDNDGNFTCTAENGYHSETRTFILRVKCESGFFLNI